MTALMYREDMHSLNKHNEESMLTWTPNSLIAHSNVKPSAPSEMLNLTAM